MARASVGAGVRVVGVSEALGRSGETARKAWSGEGPSVAVA